MNYTKDQLAVILLDSMLGLEYKNKKRILDLIGTPCELFSGKPLVREAVFDTLSESKAKTVCAALDESYLDYIIAGYEKRNTKAVTYLSDDYPEDLKYVDSPPLCLYCNGNLDLLGFEPKFSIVGSRKCLPDVCAVTKDFSAALSEAGVCVVTGSAGGADTAAIEGSVKSGKIISVIAGGINHVYPEYNKRLVGAVEKSGLVISEQPPDYEVKPWMFPVRNRIIAGLSKGVLITGGKKDSGARHTANFALDAGKEVFAFPYSLGISTGELNNYLIKNGANLCDNVNDILSFLGVQAVKEEVVDLEGDALEVYTLIKDGADSADALLEKTGLKTYELAPILTELEVGGHIVRLSGNTYKVKK